MSTSSNRRFTGGDVLMKQLNVDPPIQLLWRIDRPLDPEVLARIHENLVKGPLNRKMQDRQVPFARPIWLAHSESMPLRISAGEMAEGDVMDWADAACTTVLNAHEGRGWELRAANVSDGTSVVSLICSHALTDGQGVIAGVTLAARDSHRREHAHSTRASLVEDLADAVTQGAKTYARLALARFRSHFIGQSVVDGVRGLLGRAQPGSDGKPSVRSRIAVTVEAGEIERVSGTAGGSTTGLMLAMAANILRAARGSTEAGDPFTVALPVSFRRPDDLESSNMVGIATVRLDPRGGRYTDLPDIRRRSKAAYAGVAYGQHCTGYPHSDAALSNAGEMAPEVKNVFGLARAVLFRTVSGSGGAAGRMNCFVLKANGTVSLGLQASGVSLSRDLVDDELKAWGITPAHWW